MVAAPTAPDQIEPGARPSLVTPRFALITLSALGYFIGFGMLLPTLPRYVENDLNGGDLAIGLVAGAFGVSAGLVRPYLGRIGDRYGRRVLIVGGAALSALTILGYPIWPSIPLLIALRVVSGIGESGVFVGAATATQDLAPDDRRGEATSYFSLAVYLGLGLGPFLGELVGRSDFGFDGVVRISALMLFLSSALGWAVPRHEASGAQPPAGRRRFLHPAAVKPGLLLTLSLVGFVGFSAFLAVYLDRLGGGPNTGAAGPVFLLYSGIVIVFRLFLADLPDRLGPRRGGALAFGFIAAGFAVVAAWGTITGVYVGAAILACGMAFNYPALFLLVMRETGVTDRGHAVASFGFFFDLAGAAGAPLLGLIIDVFGDERAAFGAGAAAALIGLIGLLRLTAPSRPLPASPGGVR